MARLGLTQEDVESFSSDVEYLWCTPSTNRKATTTMTSAQSGKSTHPFAVLSQPPTPLEFSRDFVSQSRPCIIQNSILEPTLDDSETNSRNGRPVILTLDDIVDKQYLGNPNETMLQVDVTPDGHGDAVRTVSIPSSQLPSSSKEHQGPDSSILREMFVQPKECHMTLTEFRDRLRRQDQPSLEEDGQPSMSSLDVNGLPHVPLLADAESAFAEGESKTNPSPLPDNSLVYYSRQNDCLRTDLLASTDGGNNGSAGQLERNVLTEQLFPPTLPWASTAIFPQEKEDENDSHLEAMNLWMGNSRSISSMHKDPYENLFYVASGTKVFTLCPPADAPFLMSPHTEYATASFDVQTNDGTEPNNGTWGVVPHSPLDGAGTQPSTTPWIAGDVSILIHGTDDQKQALLDRYPLLRHCHPMEIRVSAGEMFYLPALWFHSVTQSCETVGVNYWYEMRMDSPTWCFFAMLQQLRLLPNDHTSTELLGVKNGEDAAEED